MENSFKKWSQNTTDDEYDKTNIVAHKEIKKRVLRRTDLKTINFEKPKLKKIMRNPKYVQSSHLGDYNDDAERKRYIPIPLKYNSV